MEMETSAVRFHVKLLFETAFNVRLQTSFPAVQYITVIKLEYKAFRIRSTAAQCETWREFFAHMDYNL